MWRFIKRMGISTQLTLITFTVMMAALILLSLASYQASTGVIRQNQYDFMRNVMARTDQTLLMFQDQLSTLLLSVSNDVRMWQSTDEEAEQILESYMTYSGSIEGLYIIRDNGAVVGVPTPAVRARGDQVAPLVREFARNRPPGIWWSEPYKSPLVGWTITVGIRAVARDGSSPGIVAADIPLLRLKSALAPISFRKPSTLFVLARGAQPVFADPESTLVPYDLLYNRLALPADVADALEGSDAATSQQVAIGGKSFHLMTGATNRFGWRTVALYAGDDIEKANAAVRQRSILLLGAFTLFSLGLGWFVARYFTAPLVRLAGEMKRVRLGHLQGVHVPDRTDEIGQLAGAFDDMMRRVRHLVRDLQESEQKKKEAEIRSLQSQIRPHFLYNVLNAIGHSAGLGRTADVYAMIRSLTRLLSFTLNKVSDKVPLAEEMEHLDHYIKLQHIRYGGSFDVTYDIGPGVSRCEVLKLTLQPLVENAIFHGLSDMSEGARLHIAAHLEEDQRLVLQVVDNGSGIPPERLKELENSAPLLGAGHMGLANVRDRLRLHYGDASSLTLDSTPGGGTTVTVIMPARTLDRAIS